jgi:hypothetical protein
MAPTTLEWGLELPNIRLVDLADESTVAAGIKGIIRLRGLTAPTVEDLAIARAYTLAVLAGLARRGL